MRPILRLGAVVVFAGLNSSIVAGDQSQTVGRSVELSKALSARITTETLTTRDLQDIHRFPAKVMLDETRVARIGPSISGRVLEVNAREGDSVHKGDVLALLSSTELGNAQASFIKSASKLTLLKATSQKAEHLFKEGIISELSLKERQVGYAHAEVELRALADQLRVMGMKQKAIDELGKTGQINSSSSVTSSIDGTIIERRMSVGQIVEISDELFTVADLSTVWVSADIPERASHLIQIGHEVEVSILALPENRYSGKIIFVSDTISPETRTVTVRMAVENTKRTLKPEMLAEMLVQGKDQNAVTVPAKAVVREGDQDYVYVQTTEGAFIQRLVRLGNESEGRRVVLSGLTVGEVIMVDGVFHFHNQNANP